MSSSTWRRRRFIVVAGRCGRHDRRGVISLADFGILAALLWLDAVLLARLAARLMLMLKVKRFAFVPVALDADDRRVLRFSRHVTVIRVGHYDIKVYCYIFSVPILLYASREKAATLEA